MICLNVIQGCNTIELTKGFASLVDAADWPVLSRHQWQASRRNGGWYAIRNVLKPTSARTSCVLMAHEVVRARGVAVPKGFQVDHENRDTLDNRRENLRLATPSDNMANRTRHKANSKSRYKGVRPASRSTKWEARISKDSRNHYIGCFDSEVEAAIAWDDAARRLHGEFAVLNFPDGPPRRP